MFNRKKIKKLTDKIIELELDLIDLKKIHDGNIILFAKFFELFESRIIKLEKKFPKYLQ